MNRTETNTLLATLAISGLRFYLFSGLLKIGSTTAILGSITILFLGLRIGWKQVRVGTLAFIGVILTTVQLIFSLIPTYDYIPSLEGFYATQFPYIKCLHPMDSIEIAIEQPNSLEKVTIINLCKRESFPLYAGQKLIQKSTGSIVISYGNGKGLIVAGPVTGTLQATESGYIFLGIYGKTNTGSTIAPHEESSTLHAIFQNYAQAKKSFLRTNYPWEREEMPLLTKIAIRKMKYLSMFDRSYGDKVINLKKYVEMTK